MPPLRIDEIDIGIPFAQEELLYRRISDGELNSMGEIDPTRISGVGYKQDVQSSPSVMRSLFCVPADVLHELCAGRDVSDWSVFGVTVAELPKELMSGDKRVFNTYPVHLPEPNCGAHSVIACSLSEAEVPTYTKPSVAVVNDLKVKLANALKKIEVKKRNGQ